MDDMTAYERKVADEILRVVGPAGPTDDAAIFSTVAAAQSPGWRFRSMFAATKFVIAAVIVALFGGFLLAGLLTQQQGEEQITAGESVSPEASPLRRVRLPAELPDDVRSGTLDTPLGAARWVRLPGDAGNWREHMQPLPAPDGFVALGDALMRSPDLLEWTSEPPPSDADSLELTLSGDSYWLIGGERAESDELWRSEDSVTWRRVDLSGLAGSPFREGLDAIVYVGTPVSSAGVTIVWLEYEPRTASFLGLPLLRGTDRVELFESTDPGIYEAQDYQGTVHTRLRFEETDSGLRVIDATDDAALAELDGVGMDFIERWAEGRILDGITRPALVEGDALVPLDLPGSPVQHAGVLATETGFLAYQVVTDSELVRLWRSDDGIGWSEMSPLGDDPSEPSSIDEVWGDERRGVVVAEGGGERWTSPDGVAWRSERIQPDLDLADGSIEFASGILRLSRNELAFDPDGDGGWATTDVTELGIDFYPDRSVVYDISPDTIFVHIHGANEDPVDWDAVWLLTFDDLPG